MRRVILRLTSAQQTLAFYVRHVNRLGDAFIAMNDGRPENRIDVRRA